MAETNASDRSTTTPLSHTAEDSRRQPLIDHLMADANRPDEKVREFAGTLAFSFCGEVCLTP